MFPFQSRCLPTNRQNLPIDTPNQPAYYPAILGEARNQFSLTRVALNTCGAREVNLYQYQWMSAACGPALPSHACGRREDRLNEALRAAIERQIADLDLKPDDVVQFLGSSDAIDQRVPRTAVFFGGKGYDSGFFQR